MFRDRPAQKYSLFISTAHKDPADEQAGTGDVDYAKVLADAIHAKGSKAYCIRGLFKERSVYQHIWANTDSKNPTLHIMINSPRTGFAFSPKGLRGFKAAGGRVVITAVEFYKHNEDAHRTNTLAYLNEAESVIFLDELDKTDAISFQEQTEPNNTPLNTLLESAKVIPVPPTVERVSNTLMERGGDILCFGMIRVGKGFAHITKLAGLIKNSTDVAVNQKKVLVVGTVQEHNAKNRELHKLMVAMYPEKQNEINIKNIPELKELLKTYQASGLESVLPIELHLDVPKENLAPLFNRCTYAFLPAYRGASLRNSSISCALAQPFVTYSYEGFITPDNLKSTGIYGNALLLLVNEETEAQNYGIYHLLADRVLADITEREKTPGLNEKTFSAAQKLMDDVLSIDKVVDSHLDAYGSNKASKGSALVKSLTAKAGIDLHVAQKAEKTISRTVFNWITEKEVKRSDDLMKQMKKMDVRALGEKNYQALLERLKKLEGDLTPAVKELLNEKKRVDEILTLEEKNFLSLVLGGDWVIKHVTPNLDVVQKAGNIMRSVNDRKIRTGKEVANSHTNPTEGHYDNVFFSMGPGKNLPTVRFLDHVKDVIVGDYKALSKQENSSLRGTWFSDHFYAYSTQQEGERVNIYGTLYNVNYRLIPRTGDIEPRWVKECEFKHPDGKVYTQTIEIGEEIFTFPRLDIAIVLMTIEKIRLLGLDAWKSIMQETDLSRLQSIVQSIYHTGVCEIHKPRRFYVGPDKPGITIEKRETIKSSAFLSGRHDENNENLVKDLLKGKTTDAINAVNTGKASSKELFHIYSVPQEGATTCKTQVASMTLMGAALLSGNIDCVKKFLEKGIDLSADCIQFGFTGFSKNTNNINILTSFNPIECVVAMSDKELFKKILNIIFKDELFDDLDARLEQMPAILKLLLERKCMIENNPHISFMTAVDSGSLEDMLLISKPMASVIKVILDYSSIPAKDLPIAKAARMGSIEIVQDMLGRGVGIDSMNSNWKNPCKTSIYNDVDGPLPVGAPAIVAAVFGGHLNICQLLIQRGASIDKPLVSENKENNGEQIREERYTALLLAVKLNNIGIAQYLLENNANIKYRAPNGNTVFTLAEKNQDKNMLNLLEEFAQKNILEDKLTTEELDALKKIPDNLFEFEVYSHTYCAIVSVINNEGDRYFITVGSGGDRATQRLLPSGDNFSEDGNGSEEELVKSMLSLFNEGLSLGVAKEDVSHLSLGEFELEVAQNKVKQKSTIVFFELLNSSHISEILKKIASFPEVAVFSASEIESLLKNGSYVHVGTGGISRLGLMICDIVAGMGKTIRPFTKTEQQGLEKKYQADYLKQYELISAAKIGNIKEIQRLLDAGTLINQEMPCTVDKAFLKDESMTIRIDEGLTPFETSIFYKQDACAKFILDQIVSELDSEEELDLNLKYWIFQLIIDNGQLEIYKILHERGDYNTRENAQFHLSKASTGASAELFQYIFNNVSNKITDLQKVVDDCLRSASASELSVEIVRFLLARASQACIDELFLVKVIFSDSEGIKNLNVKTGIFRLFVERVSKDVLSVQFSRFLSYQMYHKHAAADIEKQRVTYVSEIMKAFLLESKLGILNSDTCSHALIVIVQIPERNQFELINKVLEVGLDFQFPGIEPGYVKKLQAKYPQFLQNPVFFQAIIKHFILHNAQESKLIPFFKQLIELGIFSGCKNLIYETCQNDKNITNHLSSLISVANGQKDQGSILFLESWKGGTFELPQTVLLISEDSHNVNNANNTNNANNANNVKNTNSAFVKPPDQIKNAI